MKTLASITFLSAFSAFAILPVSFTVALSVFVTAGMLGILFWDYSRPMTGVVPAPVRRSERLGLAA